MAEAPPPAAELERALAAHRAGELAEADRLYRAVLARAPEHFDALHLLGVVCAERGAHEEARRLLEAALRLRPHSAPVCSNLGNALRGLHRLEDALARYDEALALQPDAAEVHHNRGLVLYQLGRWSEALAGHERAGVLRPEYAEARTHERFIRLRLAEANWTERLSAALITGRGPASDRQAWRRQQRAFAARVGGPEAPLWLGDHDLAGKTIVLAAGDGLGTTIQLCRYATLVAARGAEVVLRVPPSLASLVGSVRGVARVVTAGASTEADYHCPLPSLPLVFETTLATIPADVPYLAAPAPAIACWRAALGPRTRPRVGLAWAGGAWHKNDAARSLALARLAPLLATDCEFVSLHKTVRPEDAPLLGARARVRHLAGQRDFVDAAALATLMDVVVSVDTSLAHLAGALGKPVWILLSVPHDWRWLDARDDSPWYPTARLFRQPRQGDWDGVLERVAGELSALPRELPFWRGS